MHKNTTARICTFVISRKMMRYFLEIAFNGSAYFGWQRQPDAISVQEKIEDGLQKLVGREILITGAGRTDTGVHAKQLFAHFDVEAPLDIDHLKYRLNAFLPKDIAILDFFPVIPGAHARFDAIAREYEYHISFLKDPFHPSMAFYTRKRPNVMLMNEGAAALLNYEDFKCFSRTKTDVKTYHCKIQKAVWEETEAGLVFTIRADRFLRNMVRAIVGTLLDIGYGKINLEMFHQIIESKDRSKAGASAPAHGLFLTKVEYPESIKLL